MRQLPPIGAALAALTPALAAQDPAVDLEASDETIVTARKWEEALDELPGSATVVDEKELDQSGYDSLRDVGQRVPNVFFSEFSSRRLSFPFIRGIGSGLGDPAVITVIDEVPQFGFGGTNPSLLGAESVEFLRGPQALWGRNALGGMLHVRTRRPGAELVTHGAVTVGNFDRFDAELGVSGPIGDSGARFSLSALSATRDGYTRNDITGNRVDERDGFTGRGQVVLNPSDRSELLIGLTGESADDGGFVLGELNAMRLMPHRIAQDFEGVAERDYLAPHAVYRHFGDDVDVTSITSYQDWDVLETSDFDFSAVDGVRRTTREEQTVLYQEVRIASAEGADDELRWLFGASGFTSDSARSAENEFRPDGFNTVYFFPVVPGVSLNHGDFDDKGYALFGQVTLPVSDDVDVTAGLRWDKEEREASLRSTFTPTGFPAITSTESLEADFDEVLPHASASWRAREDTTLYVQASKGFKAGGFNLTAPADAFAFQPETSWTYEAGVIERWEDEGVTLRASVFRTDWDDMQLSLFDPTGGGYVDNAGESQSQGLELEAEARVDDQWSFFASVGVLDTEFDRYMSPFDGEVAGNDLPFAPDHTYGLGGLFETETGDDSSLFVRGALNGVGDFHYDAGNTEQESYSLVDLRAGYRTGRWRFDLFVQNAFDEEYVPIAVQLGPGFFVGESGAPRTFGFSLSASL